MSTWLTREGVIGYGLMISLLLSASCRSKSAESSVSKAAPSVAPSGSTAGSSAAHQLRQLWPQSGGVVLSARVALRWWGAASHVEVSRTRGFEKDVARLAGTASASDPQLEATSAELLDGLWFWRVGDAAGASRAVWSFRVRHVKGVKNAGSLLDGTDLNCDGRPDILMKGGIWLGGLRMIRVQRMIRRHHEEDFFEQLTKALALHWQPSCDRAERRTARDRYAAARG